MDNDIERMLAFINHEAKEKVNEILIKASEEYNTEKAKKVHLETQHIEKHFLSKKKDLQVKCLLEESSVKNALKLRYLREKERIVDAVFGAAVERLKCAAGAGVEECLDRVGGEIVVHCRGSDAEDVRAVLERRGAKYEIREMKEESLGGVIVCSRDNRVVCDNSYATRLSILREKYMSVISGLIFNK